MRQRRDHPAHPRYHVATPVQLRLPRAGHRGPMAGHRLGRPGPGHALLRARDGAQPPLGQQQGPFRAVRPPAVEALRRAGRRRRTWRHGLLRRPRLHRVHQAQGALPAGRVRHGHVVRHHPAEREEHRRGRPGAGHPRFHRGQMAGAQTHFLLG